MLREVPVVGADGRVILAAINLKLFHSYVLGIFVFISGGKGTKKLRYVQISLKVCSLLD